MNFQQYLEATNFEGFVPIFPTGMPTSAQTTQSTVPTATTTTTIIPGRGLQAVDTTNPASSQTTVIENPVNGNTATTATTVNTPGRQSSQATTVINSPTTTPSTAATTTTVTTPAQQGQGSTAINIPSTSTTTAPTSVTTVG